MVNVTQILAAIELGDPHTPEQLVPLVYDELRQLAAENLAHEQPGQTLQSFSAGLTALQAAAALGVSTSTAEKDWTYTRSWLRVAIDRMSGHRL